MMGQTDPWADGNHYEDPEYYRPVQDTYNGIDAPSDDTTKDGQYDYETDEPEEDEHEPPPNTAWSVGAAKANWGPQNGKMTNAQAAVFDHYYRRDRPGKRGFTQGQRASLVRKEWGPIEKARAARARYEDAKEKTHLSYWKKRGKSAAKAKVREKFGTRKRSIFS